MFSTFKSFKALSALCLTCFLPRSGAFAPASSVKLPPTMVTNRQHYPSTTCSETSWSQNRMELFAAVEENDASGPTVTPNPLYLALWVAFLGYGVFLSPGEMLDSSDTNIIQSFIEDPTNGSGAINPLLFIVFNALGIMPLVMAQLALPQGNKKGISAAPFLVGSLAAGYGALGIYLGLRAPPVDTKTRAEASWITGRILESDIFNWIVVALCGSTLFSSGVLGSSANLDSVVSEYGQLLSNSKFASVSTLDLSILTVCAATLIPRDYRLRTSNANGDDVIDDKINLVAASTVLFPVIGAALYCALRPSLPEE